MTLDERVGPFEELGRDTAGCRGLDDDPAVLDLHVDLGVLIDVSGPRIRSCYA